MRWIPAVGCMFSWASAAFGAVSAAPVGAPTAITPDDAAARFGAREGVGQISLSPDGNRSAIVKPTAGRGAVVIVVDLVKGDVTPILRSSGDPDRLTSCHWSSNTRLVCGIYMIVDGELGRLSYTRLVALDADGGRLKLLSARTSNTALGIMQSGGAVVDWGGTGDGSVLMTREFLPEQTTGTFLANTRQGLGVEAVDTLTLKRRIVESPREGATEYISDGHGTIRIMGLQPRSNSGYLKGSTEYFYRLKDHRDWQPLSTVRGAANGSSETGFDPWAVDPDKNVAYGFETKDGRRALFRVALDGSKKKELVLDRPDVDVNGLVTVGRQGRVVGASYATDRRTTLYFDPELAVLQGALGKALPGGLQLSFVDASADERKLIVFVGSDTNAGRYYLFNKNDHHLSDLLPSRPELEGLRLATQKSISFKVADGTLIPAYLTLPPGSDGKNLPAIVIPHGGPGARDEWGFDWLSQFFANRGYAVLQPNFRGSTGYGDAWFQKNGFQSWRTAIGDVNDAGRYLLSAGIAAPGKLGIFGWSYGGYAALQSPVLDPDLFKAIVAVAPVTDLETLRSEAVDFTNYGLVNAFIGHGPEVRSASPAENVSRIKAPVLMFHGDIDQNVGVGESRMMASRLRGAGKSVEYVEFHHLDHQLDDTAARTKLLAKSDAFFRQHLGL